MNDKEAPDTRPGSRRWIRVLLVVSLAFNLLIVGAVAGAVFSGGKWGRHHMHPEGPGGPLTRALSEEDRRVLKRRMLAGMLDPGQDRAARRDAMQALLTALRSEPFDASAAAAQMEVLRDSMMQRMHTGQQLLSRRFSEMSAAERATYANRLERSLRRRD
jgi:uncharacterized membrane protein